MRRIETTGKTGADGVLHLSIPLETPDQEYVVLVYVHPRITEWPPGFFEETAGSITDETFFPEIKHEEQPGA